MVVGIVNIPDLGHKRVEGRSLALHRAIAGKIRNQPELLAIARANLERWTAGDSRSNPYFEQWKSILENPLENILSLLIEDSEKMRDLRQSTPFCGVLTPQERWRIYESFSA